MSHTFINPDLDDQENYDFITKCIRETSSVFSIAFFDVLRVLDCDPSKKGIREWYEGMSLMYRPYTKGVDKRNSAEKLVSYMPVLITGARKGDVLLGTKTQSLDAVIKISKRVPPSKKVLDGIRVFPSLWKKFLTKLGSIDYFSDMSIEERRIYIEEESSLDDIYLQDVPGLKMQVLNLGSIKRNSKGTVTEKSKLLELSKKQMSRVMSEYVPVKDIQAMFPNIPGSRGLKGRSTLVFRRGIWKVSVTHREVETFDGKIIDMANGLQRKEHTTIMILEVFSKLIGFRVPTLGISDSEKVMNIVLDFHNGEYTKDDIDNIRYATETFTAAAYKSLLQKILRFRPLKIDLGEHAEHRAYPSDFVLSVTFAILLTHPGSFVPSFKRYVRGMESAFKRLVVTLFEDCYFEENNNKIVLNLTAAAFLSQRVVSWKPSLELIISALTITNIALNDSRAFKYNISRGVRLEPHRDATKKLRPLEMTSLLMDELKSFQSDLGMIRDIASYSDPPFTEQKDRPYVMPLAHCVDQHWAPEIAYLFPRGIVHKLKESGSKPFSKLMIDIFSKVTGVNPRRPRRKGRTMDIQAYNDNFENLEFTRIVRKAQSLLLVSRQGILIERELSKDVFIFDYELDRSLIAGMIGAVDISSRPGAIVTMRPSDVHSFMAIRRPSRNMKQGEFLLTEQQEENAIAKVRHNLKHGIPLNAIPPPTEKMKGVSLIYKKKKYYIRKKGVTGLKKWEDYRFSTVEIPFMKKSVLFTLENGIRYGGKGIDPNSSKRLEKLLENTSSADLRRALVYLSGFSKSIEFHHIGRGGGGSKQAVVIEDVGAYQFVLNFALLYPSAIKRQKGFTLKFKVDEPPLLWDLREQIIDYISGETHVNSEKWGRLYDRSKRSLYEHQKDALKDLKNAHIQGKQGNFIWIKAGLGKTLIVMMYLAWLKKNDSLPKYIIYAYPREAEQNTIDQCEMYGFKTKIIVTKKNITKKMKETLRDRIITDGIPSKYHINLIEHDSLRKCVEERVSSTTEEDKPNPFTISHYMPEAFFVMDEVHKTYNTTLRTAAALQFAHLAQEFVALTGTPIIDTHTYKLIQWLEQIVNFEVNEKNYWVAANDMVAKKVTTGVIVVKKEILAKFTPKQEKEYQSFVPPGMGGKNPYPGNQDFREAFNVSYKAATAEMIRSISSFLKKERNVFVVAKDSKHQEKLQNLLVSKKIVREKDIFLIGKGQSIVLTPESVKSGKTHDYKVVITTKFSSLGYTLTHLSSMVISVYPSNNATREQLEARINRIGQPKKKIYIHVIHVGILTHTMQHHNAAANLSSVISAYAKESKMK